MDTLQAATESGQQGEAAFSWLLEGLFRQGDYARLAHQLDRQAARARTIMRKDGPLAPALRFWSEPA